MYTLNIRSNDSTQVLDWCKSHFGPESNTRWQILEYYWYGPEDAYIRRPAKIQLNSFTDYLRAKLCFG